MNFSDEQIKDMLEIKERTMQRIEKYQKEIQQLEKQLGILDVIVKQSSFTKASSLAKSSPSQTDQKQMPDPIAITKGKGGENIGNAYVTAEQISIVLQESLVIDVNTPPFKTFFLDRVIGEMKKKDTQKVEQGEITIESVIDYAIKKDGSNIKEIIIKNYRDPPRVNEIINTASWSFGKMLDNTK